MQPGTVTSAPYLPLIAQISAVPSTLQALTHLALEYCDFITDTTVKQLVADFPRLGRLCVLSHSQCALLTGQVAERIADHHRRGHCRIVAADGPAHA